MIKGDYYTCYKVLLKTPCCGKQIEVASMDYYHNAIRRKKQLIETFGKKRVSVLKITKKYINKGKRIVEIGNYVEFKIYKTRRKK